MSVRLVTAGTEEVLPSIYCLETCIQCLTILTMLNASKWLAQLQSFSFQVRARDEGAGWYVTLIYFFRDSTVCLS